MTRDPGPETRDQRPKTGSSGLLDIVIKLGGSLLAHPARLDAVLAIVRDAATDSRVLIVPGGGPFADAVRQVDRDLGLSDDAAHWMAVLAMDQYAHLIISRLAGSALVEDVAGIGFAIAAARVPVLAPSRWVRDADPLPHTWGVTSDSIAAWIAGTVGAERLVVIKPPGAPARDVVDEYFYRVCPGSVTPLIVPADRTDELRAALNR
jgi:aspartokinase-like uncharacterized kinase